MPSVKGNIILSVINTVVGLLFPLVTFPYVSRVLMPEGIGTVQFYQSIINYIVLLCALGIPLYAVREIARLRDDPQQMNRATVEILLLHTLLSIIGYAVVFLMIATISRIHADWPLFLLLSLSIFFNVIGVTWFYQAMEQFKYITIRSLIVKLAAGAALFIFVRSRDDLYTYAAILVCAEVGNNLFNFIRLRKFISFSLLKGADLKVTRHLKPTLKIFMLNVAMSLYINLNPVMLGFMTDDACVGYYTAVRKIVAAANGLTLALGAAILPRLSNYFATNQIESYNKLKEKALNIIVILCFPISICTIIIAPVLIPVFSGAEYTPAILTLQLNAPAILISAFNYIIAIQILYTQNKEKMVIIATTLGGIANIIANILLIPSLQQNGAAIAGCVGEGAVLAVCLIAGNSYVKYNFLNRNNIQVIIATAICGAAVWIIGISLNISPFLLLCIQIISGILGYALSLWVLKNTIFLTYSKSLVIKGRSLLNHRTHI